MSNDFKIYLQQIVKFNNICGKVKDKYTTEDLSNQWGRVVEEVDTEFLKTLENIRKEGLTYDSRINLVDDVADIIFTNSFLEFMYGGEDNMTVPSDVIGGEVTLEELTSSHKNSSMIQLIELAYRLYDTEGLGVNFSRGLRLVCSNNLTKFPEYDLDLMNKTFDKYYGEVTCTEFIDENSKSLMIFKRISDGKVMKPFDYEPVDLSLAIEVKGEPV